MKRFAAIALVRDGKVLLGRRSAARAHYPGVWDFPGGHCEAGESFEAAMLREADEELGIRPTAWREVTRVTQAGSFELVLFAVNAWEGTAQNSAPNEHDALEWLSLDEARALPLADAAYSRLLDMLV